jgi:hypothetical protein
MVIVRLLSATNWEGNVILSQSLTRIKCRVTGQYITSKCAEFKAIFTVTTLNYTTSTSVFCICDDTRRPPMCPTVFLFKLSARITSEHHMGANVLNSLQQNVSKPQTNVHFIQEHVIKLATQTSYTKGSCRCRNCYVPALLVLQGKVSSTDTKIRHSHLQLKE